MKYDNTNNINNIKSSKYFMKGDFIVIVILLVVFIGMMVLAFQPVGERVEITIDGVLKYTYNLSEDRVIEIPFEGDEKGNVIIIENGTVYMKEATCKNQVCVHYGKIKRVGEAIICTPHKLVVEIVGKNKEIDTVAWKDLIQEKLHMYL